MRGGFEHVGLPAGQGFFAEETEVEGLEEDLEKRSVLLIFVEPFGLFLLSFVLQFLEGLVAFF